MIKKDLLQSILWLVILAGVVILVRVYVFSPVIVSGTSMDPTLEDGERVISLKFTKIKRFDIVTFQAPDDPTKNYIKRVIAFPGETVEYKEDTLYIDGKKYDEPYLDEYKSKMPTGTPLTNDFSLETLFGSSTVPKGSLFVLGDNRQISKDSRIIGFINSKKILGDVRFSFWPLHKFGFIN